MNLKSSKVGNFTVYYKNKEEFKTIYKEIFVDEEYKFNSSSKSPYILDCGSHIGLSILYFKSKYPNAKIIGFEPNPDSFEILEENIAKNHLKNVELINAAVSDTEGSTKLFSYKYERIAWTWGGSINYNQWGDAESETGKEVKTVKLSSYIDKKVDLIKLDIEGSEQKVIVDIKDNLKLVKEIILEYHGTKFNQEHNRLDLIMMILQKNYPDVTMQSFDPKDKFVQADIDRANPTISNIHAKR